MLKACPVTTILPVVDMKRARRFYEQNLGLEPAGVKPDGKVTYSCGGAILALFEREAPTRADHTALSFQVDDIESAIEGLRQRGVVFEEYDLPGLKTVNGVCVLGSEKAAWFKDTEGNILCLHQDL